MAARDPMECPVCAETVAEPRVLPGCGRTLCAACVAGCVRVGQLMRPTCRQPFLADEVRTNFFLRDPIAGVVVAAEGPLAVDLARLTLLAAAGPNGDGVLGSGSFGRVGPPSPVAWRRRDSAGQPGETCTAGEHPAGRGRRAGVRGLRRLGGPLARSTGLVRRRRRGPS